MLSGSVEEALCQHQRQPKLWFACTCVSCISIVSCNSSVRAASSNSSVARVAHVLRCFSYAWCVWTFVCLFVALLTLLICLAFPLMSTNRHKLHCHISRLCALAPWGVPYLSVSSTGSSFGNGFFASNMKHQISGCGISPIPQQPPGP